MNTSDKYDVECPVAPTPLWTKIGFAILTAVGPIVVGCLQGNDMAWGIVNTIRSTIGI